MQQDTPQDPEEFFALAEPVVGPIDREEGLTPFQKFAWSRHILREADAAYREVNPKAAKISNHWLTMTSSGEPLPLISSASAVLSAIAFSSRAMFDEEEARKYLEFVNATPMNAFAGSKCNTSFVSPNITFDLTFPAGFAPIIAPRYDGIDYEKIFVRSMWLHAIHNSILDPAINPAHAAQSKEYLQWAQVTCGITDAVGKTYTYAGVVSYEDGAGARMFPCKTLHDFALAHSGRPPSGYKSPHMSNVSQFVCAMTTYLQLYFRKAQVEQVATQPDGQVMEIGNETDAG